MTLLWRRDYPVSARTLVEAASAAPDGSFAVQRLAARVEFPDPVLAVAPDGWALAAYEDWGRTGGAIFERAPGAPGFTRVKLSPPRSGDQPVVAIRDGGGALVGWRRETAEVIEVATREQAGAFGAPRVVAYGWSINTIVAFESFRPRSRLEVPPAGIDDEPRLRAALAPDGRALLAWAGAAGRTLLWTGSTHAVLGSLGGGFEPARRLGGTLRDTDDLAPFFLPDGRAAVAWTDRAGRPSGRLHLAVEGARALERDPIRLRVRAPRFQRLARGEAPDVTAVCSGPCDVRASISVLYSDGYARSVTNPTGGAMRLHLGHVRDIRRPQSVKVRVAAGPRGGRVTAFRAIRLRLVRR